MSFHSLFFKNRASDGKATEIECYFSSSITHSRQGLLLLRVLIIRGGGGMTEKTATFTDDRTISQDQRDQSVPEGAKQG